MADFRKPSDPYLEQELESERVKLEQQFYGGYRRPPFGHIMPGVEAEGSAINNPRIATKS